MLQTGKTPVELLAANMLAAQAEADKLDALHLAIDLSQLRADDAKAYMESAGQGERAQGRCAVPATEGDAERMIAAQRCCAPILQALRRLGWSVE